MEQENKNNNAFANWLFDEFVTNHRKYGKEARVYWYILGTYSKLGFPNESQAADKKYVEKLDKIVGIAVRDWKTHLLLLRGKGAVKDFEKRMREYEERLQALGHDEESIKQLINEKMRLNDGDDIF